MKICHSRVTSLSKDSPLQPPIRTTMMVTGLSGPLFQAVIPRQSHLDNNMKSIMMTQMSLRTPTTMVLLENPVNRVTLSMNRYNFSLRNQNSADKQLGIKQRRWLHHHCSHSQLKLEMILHLRLTMAISMPTSLTASIFRTIPKTSTRK